jgi:hypothetical protein
MCNNDSLMKYDFRRTIEKVGKENPIFQTGEVLNDAMKHVAKGFGKAEITIIGKCGKKYTISINEEKDNAPHPA